MVAKDPNKDAESALVAGEEGEKKVSFSGFEHWM
jgi:hypothetical protein